MFLNTVSNADETNLKLAATAYTGSTFINPINKYTLVAVDKL